MDNEQPSGDSEVINRLAQHFAEPEAVAEEAVDESTQGEEAPAQAEAAAEEPFEIDGVEYQLPADLKAKVSEWRDGALRQQDYTRKTQEVAELHRQAVTMTEMVQRAQAFEQSVETEKSELAQVKSQLEQFKKVDWGSLDVDQYIRLKGQADTLRDRAIELNESLKTKRGEFDSWANEKKRELVATGQKYLQQTIPGWGEKHVQETIKAAKEVGMSDAELGEIYDARMIRLAWKAAQYDKLQAGKPAAVQAAQKAPPVVKPGASKGPGAQSDEGYRKTRETLRKSGNVDDFAKVLLARGLK